MAHEIDMSNDRANMAYVGETPWHGLGFRLSEHSPLEVWAKEAGLDWTLESSPAFFNDGTETLPVPGRVVLYRSDTRAPLSVVSDGYNIVQPMQVLEFYRDLITELGFEMHTAGVLRGGRKYWALAKVGQDFALGSDRVENFLLLATSCDGTLATRATYTSVRVVCNNTLTLATDEKSIVNINHSSTFNANAVKGQLSLKTSGWEEFRAKAAQMAGRRVNRTEALSWLIDIFGNPALPVEEQPNARVMQRVFELWEGTGMGSSLPSAQGTAWGLLNAVTEYVDHHRGHKRDTALDAAWFGAGALAKAKTLEVIADRVAESVL
jgi:phage/plasmid-like protein (TIGR03299 family)